MGYACHVDGISRSRGWDKEIPHGVLPMEQLVLSVKWVRKPIPIRFSNLTEFSVHLKTHFIKK